MDISTTAVKRATALAGAWAFGLWTGINYVGQLVNPTTDMFGTAPDWVSTAETMALYAILLMGVSAAGWILLDYRDGAAS